MIYRFVIGGKIIPAVRMTRRGKWVSERAQLYLASKADIQTQIKQQMLEHNWRMFPTQTPLFVQAQIQQPTGLHRSDWDNLAKNLCDSLQGLVYKDDRWIELGIVLKEKGSEYITVVLVGTMKDWEERNVGGTVFSFGGDNVPD